MAEEVKGAAQQPEQAKGAEQPKAPTLEELQKQLATLTAERDNLKKAISASNSDAAKRKKEAEDWAEKYKATLSEQDKKDMEIKAELERVKAENAVFRDTQRVATYTAKLMEVGFDAATAASMATGLPEGVDDSFFAAQKTFNESLKQTIKTEILNQQPPLSAGMPISSKDVTDKEMAQLRKWAGLK